MNDLVDLVGEDLPPEELAMLIETFAVGSRGAPPPAPSASRRLALVEATQSPVLAYAERVARLVQRSVADARALLQRLGEDAGWEPGPEPGLLFLHLPAGPALAGAVVGLVRVPPDRPFPEHEHLGEEQVLVLRGGILDPGGHLYEPGDLVTAPEGSQHSFRSAPGDELLYLSVVQEGVDFGPSGGPKILARDC